MDVARLLADEDAGWHALAAVFERIPPERFAEPTLTRGGWSPKDAMFHIGAWMADCGLQLERMRAGTFRRGEETRETIERQNQAWFELSRTMDERDVRAEFASARTRMCEEFGEMPEVTQDAWEWFEESGPLHYAEHLQDLRVFVGDDPLD
jgi:hypothetical protein